jgi:transmembrane sensor
VVAGASAADLLLLADSARFAGEAGRARQALLAARARGAKGSTAFLLGKLAADSAAAPGEAAQWFETYLAEAPAGGLAEQALGRLIEVRRRSGQTAAARAVAAKYLEKYPSGGYAGAARAALEP